MARIAHFFLHSTILLNFLSLGEISKSAGRFQEAEQLSKAVTEHFYSLFFICLQSTMPHQNFLFDDLHSFVNFPPKTTVGLAPKYTSNRKFFANLLSTAEFREMLDKDEKILRESLVKKLRFCDEAVIDKELLRDLYDREVDQSKL